MKKLILLLLLFSGLNCFSQAPHDSLNCVKPKFFGRAVPVVEYEITHEVKKLSQYQYEVVTKLYILRERQTIFEIFAQWQNLTRQSKNTEKVKEYQLTLVKKELKNLGLHE